jgi:hypothetical protein
MKEIDFLPQTYGDNRRQAMRVKKQYLALSILFLVMIIWNASARRSMNLANAALDMAEDQRVRAERVFMASDHLTRQARQMESLVRSLEQLKDNLNPAVILAELSLQVPEQIVLQRLELSSFEPSYYQDKDQMKPVQIIMSGLGADAEDVGKLIEGLESSSYFTNISITHSQTVAHANQSYSKSKMEEIWPSGAVEFELICTLATRPLAVSTTD